MLPGRHPVEVRTVHYTAVVTKEGKQTLAEFPGCPGCQTFVDPGEDLAEPCAWRRGAGCGDFQQRVPRPVDAANYCDGTPVLG